MKNSIPNQVTSLDDRVHHHDKLGPKIYETVKRKLSWGARIVQGGRAHKVFRQLFSVKEEEKLLKVSQCYLSTTAGPIAGLLFISTEKIAFCSGKSLTITSPSGELISTLYKVIIPVDKIKSATQSGNLKKPSHKYLEIVTVDSFDFWFMGFLNYEKAFKCVRQAISQS